MARTGREINQQLQALQADYAHQLPGKISQVKAAWQDFQEGNLAEVQTMLRLVHSLAGSGATFGLSGLGGAARALEQTLKVLATNVTLPAEEERTLINMQLQALCDAASQPPGKAMSEVADARASSRSPIKPDEIRLVYLIEDDDLLAQQLAAQISHFGYNVRIFNQIAEARSALKRETPAAVIADIAFPEGDKAGIKAIEETRREGIALPPLIFITSRKDFQTRLEAVRTGGNAYFIKPVDVGSLIDKLDTLTSKTQPEPFHILIVEDTPVLAAFYAYTLEEAGMVTRQVTDPMQVMDALADFSPELILMDMYMPGASGDEVSKALRQQESFLSVPIVFLSGETDLGKQLAAMDLGADDFLVKPIQPHHLVAAVTTRVERYRILRSFMIRDSLTGLLNHTKTKELLDVEIERARRHKRDLSFAMIDLDHFKRVNDTYGHPTGDRVLKNLSRLLLQRLRKVDIVGRYGGEEFALILTDTTGADAVRVLDDIRKDLAQIRQRAENAEFTVTFSCGIASYPDFATSEAICNAADKALYRAKESGRNRVVLAASSNPNQTG